MSIPVIAIVGRPNVGKSTLFNKLLGRREAIVLNRPGVTRDRHYGWFEFGGREYLLIDTGGFVTSPEEKILEHVNRQVEIAIDEADLIWFLVDQKSGLVPNDEIILKKIRSSGKAFKILCNKSDNENEPPAPEFYSLGSEIIQISAVYGNGIEAILSDLQNTLSRGGKSTSSLRGAEGDEAISSNRLLRSARNDDSRHPEATTRHPERSEGSQLKIAIVGRPNVGKSSIVNALLGSERMVVDSRPGTTRDSVDTYIKGHGEDIVLIDTAGIRRHGKREDRLESLAVMLGEKRIRNADLAWLVIDISTSITARDKRVAHMIEERGIPLIIIANKWDLVPKENREVTSKNLPKVWRGAMPSLGDAPIVTISAENNLRIHQLLSLSIKVKHDAPKILSKEELLEWLESALTKQPPPLRRNKPIIFNTVRQLRNIPPTFLFSVNRPK